jgi:hypothetical protein
MTESMKRSVNAPNPPFLRFLILATAIAQQLVTTPTGLKKVTRWVIERGMLGQYQRARGLLYPPGPPSPAND